jgi:hypothetical protein
MLQSSIIMGKEVEPTAEQNPQIFSKSDVVDLLNWIRRESHYRPDGVNSHWSHQSLSPYCAIRTESIVNEFIEYKQKQQLAASNNNSQDKK